jgi:hypothetical protein
MNKTFFDRLKWFSGAAAGPILPGITFFSNYPPPLFPGISLLTTALGAAVLCIGYFSTSGLEPNRTIRRSALALALGLGCLCTYVLLLASTTIVSPRGDHRFQVGFSTHQWSLTQTGLAAVHQQPDITKEELMMREGAYVSGGPERIWRPWTIQTAGLALICTYFLGFILWTIGFAILASLKLKEQSQDNEKLH